MLNFFIVPGFLWSDKESIPLLLKQMYPQNTEILDIPLSYLKENLLYPIIEEIVDMLYVQLCHKENNYLLIGHSQGAAIILKMLLKYSFNFNKPIILFAPMIDTKEVIHNVFSRVDKLQQIGEQWIYLTKGYSLLIDQQRVQAYEHFWDKYDLSKLKNKVILINPEFEKVLSLSHTMILKQHFPTLLEYIIPWTNHGFNTIDAKKEISKLFKTEITQYLL